MFAILDCMQQHRELQIDSGILLRGEQVSALVNHFGTIEGRFNHKQCEWGLK